MILEDVAPSKRRRRTAALQAALIQIVNHPGDFLICPALAAAMNIGHDPVRVGRFHAAAAVGHIRVSRSDGDIALGRVERHQVSVYLGLRQPGLAHGVDDRLDGGSLHVAVWFADSAVVQVQLHPGVVGVVDGAVRLLDLGYGASDG